MQRAPIPQVSSKPPSHLSGWLAVEYSVLRERSNLYFITMVLTFDDVDPFHVPFTYLYSIFEVSSSGVLIGIILSVGTAFNPSSGWSCSAFRCVSKNSSASAMMVDSMDSMDSNGQVESPIAHRMPGYRVRVRTH